MGCVVGLEVEWYLLRVAQDHLADDNIGAPGVRGRPIKTVAARAGLFLSLRIQHGPDAAGARRRWRRLSRSSACRCARSRTSGAPARSNAPSRPASALDAADNLLLFRTATRQICRRMGYFATFMCRPALEGLLFQRLASAPVAGRREQRAQPVHAGTRRRACSRRSAATSSAGCCSMPRRARAFATPTVNGYRRFRPNSLAPDRADLVLRPSRRDDARAGRRRAIRRRRIENRVGEPAANPVSLHRRRRSSPASTASSNSADPGPQDDEPYAADRPMLPKSLPEALAALEQRAAVPQRARRRVRRLFPQAQAQRGRPLPEHGSRRAACSRPTTRPTDWEQREYFDFF